jgi:hypothetical protein
MSEAGHLVYRILAIVVAALMAVSVVFAGGSVFAPNGVGEQLTGGGARVQGLAGGGIALADSLSFNSENPALAAFAPRTIFRGGGEFGVWSTMSGDRTETDTEFLWKDVALYLPMTRSWRLGLGAAPTRYMDLRTYALHSASFIEPVGASVVAYEERNIWQGSGVDWRVDNSFRVGNCCALGVSAVYTTLRIERTRTLDMEELVYRSYYFDTEYSEAERFSGWSAVGGLYVTPGQRWGLAATFRPRSRGRWKYSLTKFGTDSTERSNRRGDMPGEVRCGLSYRAGKRLMAVADAQLGQWSRGDLGIMADRADLPAPQNPLFLSAGVERLAGRPPLYSGWQNWAFRAGAYYRRHYWPLHNGQSVEDLGVTGGFSAPMNGMQTWLHAAFEGGMRGLDEDKLGARELFFRTSLQMEFSETWFQRTRPRLPK